MTDLDNYGKTLKRLEREARRLVGNWDWDIRNDELLWNRTVFRIFEIKPTDFAGTYEGFLETVHPDDREKVRVAVDDALHRNENYRIQHRIILPDRTIKIVEEKADVFFNANGNPIRMVGTVTEIKDNGNSR